MELVATPAEETDSSLEDRLARRRSRVWMAANASAAVRSAFMYTVNRKKHQNVFVISSTRPV